ncbi:uncharacterized protein PG986_011316 [Apiospora aurea]|uniref:Uncharacterized protein n=1 Tax=Apiospora aurea TaxID=335848 RepID=A0ABR1Q4R9_9PEZI
MAQNSFASPTGLGMPTGGLASRRGGQSIKPLSFDAIKAQPNSGDNGAPTPRTSRSHLLAGLRTAPKSATTGNFPASPTTAAPTSQQMYGNNNGMSSNMYAAQQGAFSGPKTSLPRMPSQQQQPQQQQPQRQQQQQQSYNQMMGGGQQQYANGQHYTAEQILPPPEIHLDEQEEGMDPLLYAQMMQANLYLAQQQQRLQQQLMQVQAAAQQFQGLSLNGQATVQQQIAISTLYQQQQQQLRNLQQQMASMPSIQQMQQPQQNIYTYYDPSTGQTYYVDQSQAQNGFNQANNNVYMEQPSTPQNFSFQQNSTPRVQVSPPADNEKPFFRSNSPPKKMELTGEPEPLPPPSANAFRRGHKKSGSQAGSNGALSLTTDNGPRTAGPKTASFPISPMPNAYGPGQARAGEHPLRQPRGPPAIDELRAKPTSRHEGSKNFAARTRRSALNNLVRAGFERRKGTGSSSGSMSPVSETAEEVGTPLTDNESDSGRSGSGSLSGDAEPSLASSRTSASGSWGAIGSDRPSSRQKTRKSVDSLSSQCDSDSGSFASVFKKGSQRDSKPQSVDGQRKAPRLVLTSAEKRKGGMAA